MLLYLSSNRNVGLFDFLTDERGITVKKLNGEFSLKKFAVRDIRNFGHCSFIAIDLSAMTDTESDLVEAIEGIKAICDTRIIILADTEHQKSGILSSFFDKGIRNFVTADLVEGIKKEILECVSEQGMSYESALRVKFLPSPQKTKAKSSKANVPKVHFNCKGLKIGVAGAASKAGTTTTAMNLTNYLSSLGARVCYVEANSNKHLATLPLFYPEMVTKEDRIEYMGIRYFFSNATFNSSMYNFNIYDFGVLSKRHANVFNECDVKVLCSASKPYELGDLLEALKFADYGVNIVFAFAAEGNREDIARLVNSKNSNIYFNNYSPSLFDCGANKALWKHILDKYVALL